MTRSTESTAIEPTDSVSAAVLVEQIADWALAACTSELSAFKKTVEAPGLTAVVWLFGRASCWVEFRKPDRGDEQLKIAFLSDYPEERKLKEKRKWRTAAAESRADPNDGSAFKLGNHETVVLSPSLDSGLVKHQIMLYLLRKRFLSPEDVQAEYDALMREIIRPAFRSVAGKLGCSREHEEDECSKALLAILKMYSSPESPLALPAYTRETIKGSLLEMREKEYLVSIREFDEGCPVDPESPKGVTTAPRRLKPSPDQAPNEFAVVTAAQMIGVARRTLYDWIKTGRTKVHYRRTKAGAIRISRNEVLRLKKLQQLRLERRDRIKSVAKLEGIQEASARRRVERTDKTASGQAQEPANNGNAVGGARGEKAMAPRRVKKMV